MPRSDMDASSSGAEVKVLIVEADRTVSDMLALQVRMASATPLVAATEAETLVLAALHVPDLILLNLMLEGDPYLGARVMKQLQDQPVTRYIPILLHTIQRHGEHGTPVITQVAHGFMRRPFPPTGLDELFRHLRVAPDMLES